MNAIMQPCWIQLQRVVQRGRQLGGQGKPQVSHFPSRHISVAKLQYYARFVSRANQPEHHSLESPTHQCGKAKSECNHRSHACGVFCLAFHMTSWFEPLGRMIPAYQHEFPLGSRAVNEHAGNVKQTLLSRCLRAGRGSIIHDAS
jgi:hypothetical protein